MGEYLKLDPLNGIPIRFKCKRCGASGLSVFKKRRQWGVSGSTVVTSNSYGILAQQDILRLGQMLKPEIAEFLEDFRPRTHAIVFYDSEQNKQELLFSHLKFGAENDQGLAYVCSEQNPLASPSSYYPLGDVFAIFFAFLFLGAGLYFMMKDSMEKVRQ